MSADSSDIDFDDLLSTTDSEGQLPRASQARKTESATTTTAKQPAVEAVSASKESSIAAPAVIVVPKPAPAAKQTLVNDIDELESKLFGFSSKPKAKEPAPVAALPASLSSAAAKPDNTESGTRAFSNLFKAADASFQAPQAESVKTPFAVTAVTASASETAPNEYFPEFLNVSRPRRRGRGQVPSSNSQDNLEESKPIALEFPLKLDSAPEPAKDPLLFLGASKSFRRDESDIAPVVQKTVEEQQDTKAVEELKSAPRSAENLPTLPKQQPEPAMVEATSVAVAEKSVRLDSILNATVPSVIRESREAILQHPQPRLNKTFSNHVSLTAVTGNVPVAPAWGFGLENLNELKAMILDLQTEISKNAAKDQASNELREKKTLLEGMNAQLNSEILSLKSSLHEKELAIKNLENTQKYELSNIRLAHKSEIQEEKLKWTQAKNDALHELRLEYEDKLGAASATRHDEISRLKREHQDEIRRISVLTEERHGQIAAVETFASACSKFETLQSEWSAQAMADLQEREKMLREGEREVFKIREQFAKQQRDLDKERSVLRQKLSAYDDELAVKQCDFAAQRDAMKREYEQLRTDYEILRDQNAALRQSSNTTSVFHEEVLREKSKLQKQVNAERQRLLQERNELEIAKKKLLDSESDLKQRRDVQAMELEAERHLLENESRLVQQRSREVFEKLAAIKTQIKEMEHERAQLDAERDVVQKTKRDLDERFEVCKKSQVEAVTEREKAERYLAKISAVKSTLDGELARIHEEKENLEHVKHELLSDSNQEKSVSEHEDTLSDDLDDEKNSHKTEDIERDLRSFASSAKSKKSAAAFKKTALAHMHETLRNSLNNSKEAQALVGILGEFISEARVETDDVENVY